MRPGTQRCCARCWTSRRLRGGQRPSSSGDGRPWGAGRCAPRAAARQRLLTSHRGVRTLRAVAAVDAEGDMPRPRPRRWLRRAAALPVGPQAELHAVRKPGASCCLLWRQAKAGRWTAPLRNVLCPARAVSCRWPQGAAIDNSMLRLGPLACLGCKMPEFEAPACPACSTAHHHPRDNRGCFPRHVGWQKSLTPRAHLPPCPHYSGLPRAS
jgi:hypothetical protein